MDPNQHIPIPIPKPKVGFFTRLVNGFKGLATIFSSIVKILFAIVGILFLTTLITELSTTSQEAGTTYREVIYQGTSETIAIIDLNGIIADVVPQGPFDYVTETQMITPRRVTKLLEEIAYDNNVVAVIFRINSPGGSVTASEDIYQTIKRFADENEMPVIVSQGEVAASGGYYISLAGDTIISDPTTLTGSIGVIASTLNFKELADEYGVKEIAVTTGSNKNFFSPFQEMSEEQQSIIQSIIDEAYDMFLSRIRESRDVDEGTLTALADGRPLSGLQAYNAGLVDKTGTFYDTVQLAKEQSGYKRAQVVEYTDQGVLESLFGIVSKPLMNKLPFSLFDPYTSLSGKPAYLYGGM